MPLRLLIVDPVEKSREAVLRTLTGTGHFVTALSNFQAAKERIFLAPPDLLITALRLGPYNGLHLVLRAPSGTPAIVLDNMYDVVLERESINAGAVYLTAPVDDASLIAIVQRLLNDASTPPSAAVPRKWPRKLAGMSVEVSGDEGRVVDVSYGGLRLELSGVPDDAVLAITSIAIPAVGTVAIHPVWARTAATGTHHWWCGAEVEISDGETVDAWRRFVDSLH